jgi:hypothetical protein
MPLSEEQISKIREQRERQKLSAVFEMPDLAQPDECLSEAETDFFRDNGFLIKPGLLDQDQVKSALDEVWTHLVDHVPMAPGAKLSREDKESWRAPVWADMQPHPTSGPYQGRQPIEHFGRTVKLHDIGDQGYLLDLLPRNEQVVEVATRLLGENLRPTTVSRGVYAVFPPADDGKNPDRLRGASLGPHTDQVCQQLNVSAYLDDVGPRNGGFTVYPGSHKLMYQAHTHDANWSPTTGFREAMRQVIDTIEPLELCAKQGSVIFWHGRMVHSAGIHTGEDIRWALFGDYTLDEDILDEDEHRAVGQYEWFKNAKLFRHDAPASEDMWARWACG